MMKALLTILALLVATLLLACSSGGAPSPAPEQGPDFTVKGVDPSALCLDVAALPTDFQFDGERALDAVAAAHEAADPVQRQREYANWGWAAGFGRQWVIAKPLECGCAESGRHSPFGIDPGPGESG